MAKRLKDDAGDNGAVPPAVIRDHFKKIQAIYLKKKSIDSELQTAFKTAKSDGVPTDELKMARKFAKMDSEVAVKFLEQLGYVAKVLGMPFAKQTSMFSEIEVEADQESEDAQAEWDAATAGHDAAADGTPREDNPHDAGSALYDTWDRAWLTKTEESEKAAKAGAPKVSKPRGRKAKGNSIVDGAESVH